MANRISRDSIAVHPITSFETEIVVDLGCCSFQHGSQVEDSIQTLVKRFKPGVLFGFDPHPGLREAVGQVYGTTVVTSRCAAWVFDGDLGITVNSNCTHVDTRVSPITKAFNLASWVRALPDVNIVLKMDVEGAEYVLLPHLIKQGVIDRFSRLLLEWHQGKYANGFESERETILADIPCPIEEWR